MNATSVVVACVVLTWGSPAAVFAQHAPNAAQDQPPKSAPASAPDSPPAAASDPTVAGHADQLADQVAARARAAYLDAKTFSARVELVSRAIREGADAPVDTVMYFTDLAFARPWSIRSHTTEEINGIDGDRCWCAMPDTKEWFDAPLPPEDLRDHWLKIQHWIPYAGLGLWQTIAGLPDAPAHVATTLASVTSVTTRDNNGRSITEITGTSPHPWALAGPAVDTILLFDNQSGTLIEAAWESTRHQQQQDGYKEDREGVKPAVKKAWYVVKVSGEKLNEPIDPATFAPPADFKKVPLLAGPRGHSAKFMGQTVPAVGTSRETPDLNLGMFKDKVWVLYIGLMGDELELEPGILSMEWLHDTLAPRGLHVLSVGNYMGPTDMTRARAWGKAHQIQHRTIAGPDGDKFPFRPQQYWPVILLSDGDATVQAAFTGYSPAFSLALREWAIKLLDHQPVWTDEQVQAWRAAGGNPGR